MLRRRSRSARSPRKKRSRGRRLFLRGSLALALATGVLAAAVVLHLYVTVTRRFEGGLWTLPAQVLSDILVLAPGTPCTARQLTQRLERSGYGRMADGPQRAGQYRDGTNLVEVDTRAFRHDGRDISGQRARIRFAGGRVTAVTDGRGRPLVRVVFEPELLATLYGPRQEDRRLVDLDDVPRPFIHAVLAIEDARYFSHHGVDPRGLLRAAWTNLREGRVLQGGSTITQQTVKNLFLGQERSFWRKSREGLMSLILETRYPKERILEVYLNEVYLGQRGPVAICGFQAAARFYLGRDLAALSLGESALLAGLISSPGRYNPFAHPEAALERRNHVLDAMLRLGWVEPEAHARARQEPLRLASGAGGFTAAPWVADFVRSQLAPQFAAEALQSEGLAIYTTIDTRWQAAAQQALDAGLERLERESPKIRKQRRQRRIEGAAIVTDPASGAVLALVGGRDYQRSQFNRAVQAKRQPGSCFKPFVYAAGFEQAAAGEGGLTAATLLEDSPLELELDAEGQSWSPANYDGEYRGWVSARTALEQSLNVPTVRAAAIVTLEAAVAVAQRCGIRSPLEPVPALALGTEVVTPLELATAYGTLANGGRYRMPWIIREIRDRNDAVVARRPDEEPEQAALGPQTAFLVNDILRGVVERGTAASARALGYAGNAAGKTGTTDDTRDAWFVGYTPDHLGLVWVGYDDNAATGLTGATGALPIWVDLMRRAGQPAQADFAEPPGIVHALIDPETGELAEPACPTVVEELFAAGTEPEDPCSLHGGGRLRRWLHRLFGKRDREPARLPGV